MLEMLVKKNAQKTISNEYTRTQKVDLKSTMGGV